MKALRGIVKRAIRRKGHIGRVWPMRLEVGDRTAGEHGEVFRGPFVPRQAGRKSMVGKMERGKDHIRKKGMEVDHDE